MIPTKNVKQYWVLVYSDREKTNMNGRPIPPIDTDMNHPTGMMVYRTECEAFAATKRFMQLYGMPCRPVLLGQELD